MAKLGEFWRGRTEKAHPLTEDFLQVSEDFEKVLSAAPSPLSATDRLGRNLERTVFESTSRAEVLRQEIAAREAELADVLRAEEAARIGLEALDDRITEDDLSAACGLALEAEMRIPFENAPVEILEELLSTEQIPQERFDEEMKRREKANG